MEKEFVSYEQALALKELGIYIPPPCYSVYRKYNNVGAVLLINAESMETIDLVAPLKQQVFRWFREKYGLQAYLTTFLEMCRNDGDTYHVVVGGSWYPQLDSMDYEKAENAAIDKLIERAKQQEND